jgi:hypothetical protein
MASEKAGKTVGDFVTLQRGTTYSGSLVGLPGPASSHPGPRGLDTCQL